MKTNKSLSLVFRNRKAIIIITDVVLSIIILFSILFLASVDAESLSMLVLFIVISIFVLSVLAARFVGTFKRISKVSDRYFPDPKMEPLK